MGLTILRAQQLSSEPIQLAVWDGQETAEKAGSFADIQVWQRQGLKTVTIGSDGNLGANGVKHAEPESGSHTLPGRKVRAIMFGDFHGFSRLSDRQLLTFYSQVMQCVAAALDTFPATLPHATPGATGCLSSSRILAPPHAAPCKSKRSWRGSTSPRSACRQASACGSASTPARYSKFMTLTLKLLTSTLTHINRTARLEPNTPPGEVYVTEAFAALFTLIEDEELICEYVGLMQAAKNYGRLRTYLLRRRAYA